MSVKTKDSLLEQATEHVGYVFEGLAAESARAALLALCGWLNDEETLNEIAAELLRGTPSTDLTAAKERAREVVDVVVSALRRRGRVGVMTTTPHRPFDADLVDVTDVLPPWLPAVDLDPDWRIDHGNFPHSVDEALIEKKEETGVR